MGGTMKGSPFFDDSRFDTHNGGNPMKKWFWLAGVALVVTLSACSLPKLSLFPQAGPLKEVTLEGTGEAKVLVLTINGAVSDQPKEKLLRSSPGMVQDLVTHLQRAEKDPQIKALLLKVNSPGGPVTASDILYHEISDFKEHTGAKVVVAMMDVAASGGYYLSLPADWIMAHPTTVTGSIGVIFMRPGVSGFMEKYGFAMNVNKSGELKDMGSPFRPPTEKDEAIFQELTDQMAQRFYSLVEKHRKLSPEQMQKIKTARIFLAPEALQLGLIDQIGYLKDAVAKAKSLAGLKPDAKVVAYRRFESEEDNIYDPAMSGPQGGPAANLPTLTQFLAIPEAGFYYMWPAAVGGE
jgi:protease-4